ncbi:MAG: N-acetyl-gamma-glutamyl-phosphate reductase [Actinobacteria bacterium]|nr:N-acetyl-gamma-glutamyl-phosphate reductase [Actinomycetota bacterium]MCL6094772.1 N-acetyl-gamma-glutamyl-phosphate reductase [Actinomycetota bacterium]
MNVGVVGASGYTGAELLRICAVHPEFDVQVVQAHTHAGERVGSVYPSLLPAYKDMSFSPIAAEELFDLDLVFLGLPHGQSQSIVPKLVESPVSHILDLAADFRLRDPEVYRRWYGAEHSAVDLLPRFVYGLPELYRTELEGARLIAVPGCYPTAASLALAPFTSRGLLDKKGIIVDAASGLSGAGRGLSDTTHFSAANEDFSAYGLSNHRHIPEIEQVCNAEVLFTPHLAPMTRGILATCYGRPVQDIDTEQALQVLYEEYENCPFVVVQEDLPSTKQVLGSNYARISVRVDRRTGWVVLLCAIDNLVKGAAGQGVQCANLAVGLGETTGLESPGLYP